MTAITDICQIEIRGRDLGRAADFYRTALGWHLEPSGEPGLLFALTGRQPLVQLLETPHDGVPVCVVAFVAVADCAASVAAAEELGATVIVPPLPAGTAGMWAVCGDPWGNELGFWQAAPGWDPSPGDALHHPMVWLELRAPDLVAAVRYYRRVCGWSFQVTPGVDGFAFYRRESAPVGVGLVGGERAERLRQATVYVETADLEGSLAAALAAGATLLVEPTPGPEGGRFALFADPDGNPIGLFEA